MRKAIIVVVIACAAILLGVLAAHAAGSTFILPYGDTLTVQCESAHMAPRADNRGALIILRCVPSDVYPTPAPIRTETTFMPLLVVGPRSGILERADG